MKDGPFDIQKWVGVGIFPHDKAVVSLFAQQVTFRNLAETSLLESNALNFKKVIENTI